MYQLDYVVTHLESKKRITKANIPVWRARDLMPILGYVEWENFRKAIDKAIESCVKSEMNPTDHFRETTTMVSIGSKAKRQVEDWYLSKHGCYLIAMNADASKPEIATAQAYFSVQTHKQEAIDEMSEEQRRLVLRNRLKDGNQRLSAAAAQAGVEKFGVFHDAGYKGLYRMGKESVQQLKRLPSGEDLLDCIGPSELAANEFRVTQTEDKLRRENIIGEQKAIDTHFAVGSKVRSTIKELGGTMPENLPPQPSIKKLAAKHSREIKKLVKAKD